MIEQTLGALLGSHAEEKPESEVAVLYPDGALTWKALDERSSRRALQFRSLGVSPNDMVAIAMPNSATHHEVTFGAWKAGATPCILPPKLPNRELSEIVQLATPKLLVRSSTDSQQNIVQLDPADQPPPLVRSDLPDVAPRFWKAVASGGSTGRPKLIVDHGPGLFNEGIKGFIDYLGLPRDGVLLNPGPLYHNAPFLFSHLALFAGSRVIGMNRFDAEECLRLIELHKVNWVFLVPTMMSRIWNLPRSTRERYDLSSLRTVWHMAAACPMWLKRAWIEWLGPDRILEAYAGTESAGVFITGREWLQNPGSVGRIAPGTISIRDEAGAECATGTIGEIFFPADSKKKFHYIGEAPKCDKHGRFSLGDLGHVDENGYLYLADRRTDLIVRGGANVYPAEVEAALDEYPSIANSVAIGLPCDEYGQRVHAILEPVSGGQILIEEVDKFARSCLSSYKCPESYEIVHSSLRDEAGKVRRSALKSEREGWLKNGFTFQTFVGKQKR